VNPRFGVNDIFGFTPWDRWLDFIADRNYERPVSPDQFTSPVESEGASSDGPSNMDGSESGFTAPADDMFSDVCSDLE
jgi:hypothetical protein